MSTRSGRVGWNGTPSASSSARWRAPLASEPSARTTRCQGTSSAVPCSTVPAKRRAPGDTSPYVRTKPSGIARTRCRTVCSRSMRKGTYSIVARDPATGDLGVAVQSHWFSVGSVVAWARTGTGAVATQSVAEIAYGPRVLDRLAAGEDATSALRAELDADASARVRQVAVVDAHGRVAVHTGEDCIPHAGHEPGDQFSCQANMMAHETVPAAMAAAYREADGPLADRLLAALLAA